MTFLLKISTFVIIVVTIGYGMHQAFEVRERNHTITQLKQQVAKENEQLKRLSAEYDDLKRLASESTPVATEDLVLTSGDNEFDESMRKLLKRVYRFKKWVEATPGVETPEYTFLDDAQWFAIVARTRFKNEADYYSAARQLKQQAQFGFFNLLVSALNGYLQSSGGQLPVDIKLLEPFFVVPVDAALLGRYEMAATGEAQAISKTEPIFREKVAEGSHRVLRFAQVSGIGVSIDSGFDTESSAESPREKAIHASEVAQVQITNAVTKYMSEHGSRPKNKNDLLPYIDDPSVLQHLKLP